MGPAAELCPWDLIVAVFQLILPTGKQAIEKIPLCHSNLVNICDVSTFVYLSELYHRIHIPLGTCHSG